MWNCGSECVVREQGRLFEGEVEMKNNETIRIEDNELIKKYESLLLEKNYLKLDSKMFTEDKLKKDNLLLARDSLKNYLNLDKHKANEYCKFVKESFLGKYKGLREKQSYLYFEEKINLVKVNSIQEYIQLLNGKGQKCENFKEGLLKDSIYFRGQSNIEYTVKPSVYRNRQLDNESKNFKELLFRNPLDFEQEQTIFEKLVKMQHYGLPTRLLDLTKNPLVALYFAVENNDEYDGEILFFNGQDNKLYFDDEKVRILSLLTQIDKRFTEDELMTLCKKQYLDFKEIGKDYFDYCSFVEAKKNNKRILNQQGSFLFCGTKLDKEEKYFLKSGCSEISKYFMKDSKGRQIVFYISCDKKKQIKDELDKLNINKAFIYPEIDDVADYLREKGI